LVGGKNNLVQKMNISFSLHPALQGKPMDKKATLSAQDI
jgi:hypothetical protein